MIGLFETRTRPLNRFCEFFNGFVLANHTLAKGIGHGKQSATFILCHPFYRNTCNHRDNRGDIVFGNHNLFGCRLRFPSGLGRFEFFQQTLFGISQLGGFLKILTLHHLVFLQLNGFDLGFEIHNF